MSKRKPPLCVRWPEDLERAAKQLAAQNDSTLSAISRQAMQRMLEAEGMMPTAPRGVVGRGSQSPESGSSLADPHAAPPDLSVVRNVDSRII